jgi:hypothetical protein
MTIAYYSNAGNMTVFTETSLDGFPIEVTARDQEAIFGIQGNCVYRWTAKMTPRAAFDLLAEACVMTRAEIVSRYPENSGF